MIEQPLWSDDFYFHARLQKQLQTAICLDEAIRSSRDAEAALELGACRIVNIKVGRIGGFTDAIAVHDIAQRFGVPVWCGGMLESGVGRSHNAALSTLPNFRLPGDVSASKRYWKRTSSSLRLRCRRRNDPLSLTSRVAATILTTGVDRKLTVRKETLRAASS
jgi:O-succinylbenzoate synthase